LFFASVLVLVGFDSNASGQTTTPPQILPYLVNTIAGGAASNPAAGATCPVSGKTSSDSFGDGCLATEVMLKAPGFVTEDKGGNIFFSDTTNALIRRIDA
jgi:hypothetical protein